MSKENLKKFLEFFSYIFHISEKARRASLPLNFKQGANVLDFVSDLEVKLQEHTQMTDVKNAVAAPVQSTTKNTVICNNCKKSSQKLYCQQYESR